MANYVTTTSAKHFQPMNASFALLPALEGKKIRKNVSVMKRLVSVVWLV